MPEPDTTRLVRGLRRRWLTIVIGAVAGAALLLGATRLTSSAKWQSTVRLAAVDDSSLVAAMDLPPQLAVRRVPLSAEASRLESAEFKAKVVEQLGRKFKVAAATADGANTLVIAVTQDSAEDATQASGAVIDELISRRKAEFASDIAIANKALDATLESLAAQRTAIDAQLSKASTSEVTDSSLISERTKVVELEAKARATKVSLAEIRDNNEGRLQILARRTDEVSSSGIPQGVAGGLLGAIVGGSVALMLASGDRRLYSRRDIEAAIDPVTVLTTLALPMPPDQIELARQIVGRRGNGGTVDLLAVDDATRESTAFADLATALGDSARVAHDVASVDHPAIAVALAGVTYRESLMIAAADLDGKGATLLGAMLIGVPPKQHRYAAS